MYAFAYFGYTDAHISLSTCMCIYMYVYIYICRRRRRHRRHPTVARWLKMAPKAKRQSGTRPPGARTRARGFQGASGWKRYNMRLAAEQVEI